MEAAPWQTLPEMLMAQAAASPDRIVFTHLERGEDVGQSLTFAEVLRQARRCAAGLQRTTSLGDRVMLVFPNEPDFIVALLACVLAGLVAVPAAPPRNARTLDRLRNLADTAGARMVIVSEHLRGVFQKLGQADLAQGEWVFVGDLPPTDVAAFRPPHLSAQSIAVLQFTSGSTGNQKGVMVTHANILHNCRVLSKPCGTGDAMRMVSWLPFFHDWGLVGCLFLPLWSGGSCHFFDPADFLRRPRRWLEAISLHRATVACAPNFAYALCTGTADEGGPRLDLSGWRLAMIGAEPVRHDTIEGFAAAFASAGFRPDALFPSYGLAENTLMATGGQDHAAPIYLRLDRIALAAGRAVLATATQPESQTGLWVGCGQALLDQTVLIVDPKTRQPRADAEVGEVWIAGGSVTAGYWGRADDTAASFHATLANRADPRFLRTGDLGFLWQSELFICGRLKDVVIKAGANFLAEDLELSMLRADPGLRVGCGAAFSLDIAGSERMVLVHEVNYGKKPELPRLVGAIQRAVSEDHGVMADAIVIVAPGSLEKTSSGKIRRQHIKLLFERGELDPLWLWQSW